MKTYIQFDSEGRQIAAVTSERLPEGEGWKVAPEDFDWNALYKLEGEEILRFSEEDLLFIAANNERKRALMELPRLIAEILKAERGTSLEALEALRTEYELSQKALHTPEDTALHEQIQPLLDAEELNLQTFIDKIKPEFEEATHLLIFVRATIRKLQRQLAALTTAEEITQVMDAELQTFAQELKGGSHA